MLGQEIIPARAEVPSVPTVEADPPSVASSMSAVDPAVDGQVVGELGPIFDEHVPAESPTRHLPHLARDPVVGGPGFEDEGDQG